METLSLLEKFLPPGLLREIHALTACRAEGHLLNEIRLRADRPCGLLFPSGSLPLTTRLTHQELSQIFYRLCHGSVYAFRDQVKEGVLSPGGGIRVGVAGRAVSEGEGVSGVAEIFSLVFRIPHRVPGAGDIALAALERSAGRGILICSPPGGGKTTILRELIDALTAGEEERRVAVVDSRGEFFGTLSPRSRAEVLLGYPKAEGIALAVRTLSPRWVICDEVGGEEDAMAIRQAAVCGVSTVASLHGKGKGSLLASPSGRALLESGLFGALITSANQNGRFLTQVEYL